MSRRAALCRSKTKTLRQVLANSACSTMDRVLHTIGHEQHCVLSLVHAGVYPATFCADLRLRLPQTPTVVLSLALQRSIAAAGGHQQPVSSQETAWRTLAEALGPLAPQAQHQQQQRRQELRTSRSRRCPSNLLLASLYPSCALTFLAGHLSCVASSCTPYDAQSCLC